MLDVFNPTNQEFLASNYKAIGDENESNFITDAADWVTKGVPLAVSSGVAQMWNSIGWAGNKIANIGSDNPEPFTDDLDYTWLVNNFDDAESYKTYYGEHQEGIDLGGFILGSVVPSGVAVKGLTALQKGLAVSRAASATTGLLTNSAERYWLNKAALQMANGSGTVGSRIGASGSKFAQTALEILAAETATYASMSQSPIYKDVNSVGDFVGNALTGAATFGALGGLWRLGTFKRARFDLVDAIRVDGTTGNVTTNLLEVEKQVGKVLQDASFTSHSNPMAGLKVKLDRKKQVKDPLQADLKNVLNATLAPEKSTGASKSFLTNRDRYIYTIGDDITNTIAAREKVVGQIKNIEDVTKSRGAFTDALASRHRQTLAATKAANDTYMNKLFTELADDADLAQPVKALTDNLLAKGKSANVRQIFTGAAKVTRATEDANKSLAHQIIDLSDGSINNQAVNTLGDFGKVKFVNSKLVTVSGRAVDLSKVTKSIDNFRKATAAEAQATYYAEFNALEKGGESVLIDKVDSWNLPKVEAYYRKHNGFTNEAGITYRGEEALNKIRELKLAEKDKLIELNPNITYPEIKTRLNVTDAFFGKRNIPAEAVVNGIDTEALRHVAVRYAVETKVPNFFEIRSAAFNEAKHDIYQEFQDEIANRILGAGNKFIKLNMSEYEGIDRGAGVITAANAEYGTFWSKAQHIGLQTQTTLMKWRDDSLRRFLGSTNRLRATGDGSAANTELAAIKAMVTSSEDKFVINKAGEIKPLSQLDDKSFVSVATVKNQEVLDFLKVYLAEDALRTQRKNLSLRGIGKKVIERYDDGEWEELYFAPPHPDDFAHKVLVSDNQGSVGMVFASTEKELTQKVALVAQANPEYIIRTPKDIDSYHQLLGDYEDALTLRGSTKIDTTLKSQGVLSDLAPTTNAQDLVNGFMNDFARSERTTMNNALMLKYGQQLAEAQQMKEVLGKAGGDNIGVKKIFNTLFNFYDQDTTWHKFNNLVERTSDWTGGKVIAGIKDNWSDLVSGKKSVSQLEANSIAKSYGTDIFGSDALWKLSKAHTYKDTTQKTLRNTNALMRSLVLGVDYFNGLVNIIGTPILALPEIRAAFGSGQDIPYMKLMGEAMKDMFGAGRRADLERYSKLGIVNENMYVYHDLLDNHAIMMGATNEAAALTASKSVWQTADKYFTKLQAPTAFAEQSTQLFAARLADKIGNLRGIKGEELDAFITTFTKKVVGNYTSAQRPLVFQGILGQAVGLFQTYSFNLFQQATRHIANGNDKAVAMMAALQGTIFGAQSLPGFNIANQGLAAWGGDDYKDAYSETRRILGEDVANAVLYGSASNLLGANLWVRGDTNPRNITGIPITPSDLAQVSYYGKALGAMKQWGDSILSGGNIKVSTLEAIAHANISRPLTGLTELALGAKTTAGGTLETAVGQDLLSWASAVRLMGAKPMQEALTSEATYKFGVIRAREQKELNDLAYALRTEMLADKGTVSQDVISEYAKKYVEVGGHPQGFRKWYLANLAKATTPRAQLFADAIKKNPWAKTYQELASPDLSEGLEESMQTPPEQRQQQE